MTVDDVMYQSDLVSSGTYVEDSQSQDRMSVVLEAAETAAAEGGPGLTSTPPRISSRATKIAWRELCFVGR